MLPKEVEDLALFCSGSEALYIISSNSKFIHSLVFHNSSIQLQQTNTKQSPFDKLVACLMRGGSTGLVETGDEQFNKPVGEGVSADWRSGCGK